MTAAGATDRPPAEDGLLPGELGRPVADSTRSTRAAEIVAVARFLLESNGPEALTMRGVADRLGMQAPSLYKHFASKAVLEAALVEEAFVELGGASHAALREADPLGALLRTYRSHALGHPHLYRLATAGPLARPLLAPGVEEWAGNPWFVVTGDPALAQALWSFAHGMVILEIDGRYPPHSDLDATWRAGGEAFRRAARGRRARG